jgi:hypothetical protein
MMLTLPLRVALLNTSLDPLVDLALDPTASVLPERNGLREPAAINLAVDGAAAKRAALHDLVDAKNGIANRGAIL